MHKTKQLVIHSSPLAFGVLLSGLFWQNNFILLCVYSALVLAFIFMGKDKKSEFIIFIYGAIIGFAIETIGAKAGYHSFANPDILGIPYWLVVAWGYGFILMKRIGLIIAKNSPWASD